MVIEKIVFTGDFLRPNVAGDKPTQHHNIRWLMNIVSTQLSIATNLPQNVIAWGDSIVQDGKLTYSDVNSIYKYFGLPLDIKSWALLHGETALPPKVEAMFDYFFSGSLIIGFEIPPYLEAYFNRRNLPFVAATIHPVRFLDDIFLGMRSNITDIQDKLFKYRIDESFISTMAGVQRASAARTVADILKPESAFFVMQTWYDQSQILNGRFVSASDYIDQIAVIARDHNELLLKEHPLAPNPATALILAYIPNVRMVSGNAYGYLSVPEVVTLATMSSSVGVEAPYFGTPSQFLLRDPILRRRTTTDPPDGYVGIYDAFLNPDFWRQALYDITPVTASDGLRIPHKPNRLRISLRSFWNFNQIDTDVSHSTWKGSGAKS